MKLTEQQSAFLSRFVTRGWLHVIRDDEMEQRAVHIALRKRYLRRELSEAHFTPAGRSALSQNESALSHNEGDRK